MNKLSMPRHQVRFDIYFARSQAAVFALFDSHEHFGRFWPGQTRRIRVGDNPAQPDGIGSVRENISLGGRLEETITRYEVPSRIEYQVTRGSPVKNHLGRLRFLPEGEGTRLIYTIDFDPRLPGTGWFLVWYMRWAFHAGLRRMRPVCLPWHRAMPER